MSLEVGKNSYLTLDEADVYVSLNYPRLSPQRVIWSVLTSDEKTAYLLSALTELEQLPVSGRKFNFLQSLQFPRQEVGQFAGMFHGNNLIYQNTSEIPQEVKAAQIEIALALIEKECSAQAAKQSATMQSLGVMKNIKFSKKDVPDAMFGGVEGGNTASKSLLSSIKAEALMRKFLGTVRC